MHKMVRVMFFVVVVACAGLGTAYGQERSGLAPGWLSLDSSVGKMDKGIQDAKSELEKYLFGFKVSGFFDSSYTWSSNHPGSGSSHDISGRVFEKDDNSIVFNDFNITLDRPEPEKGWGVGVRMAADFGRTAELLREATYYGECKLPGCGNGGEPSAELREAYLTTTVPVGKGLNLKGGLFVTTLGNEIIPNPGAYNDNMSRSYLFGYAIPFRHLGMLMSYPVHDMVSVSVGPVTGWDNPHDNNKQPSFLSAVTVTPAKNFSLVSSFIYGPEQFHQNGNDRYAWSNVGIWTPMEPMAVTVEYTYGHEQNVTTSGRDAFWQGLASYLSYSWTDRFSTSLRGEFFKDADGARFGGSLRGGQMDVTLGEATLTFAYKFTDMLLGRAEIRQDWANSQMFQKGNTGSDANQTTLGFQAIYQF
ncbi:MAG TPA: outer membrane beta-barrel protein [Candidatus Binatia bacterium]